MTKLNLNFKLFFLTKIIVIFIIICTKSYADTSIEKSAYIILGKDDAPVKIKIYSSLTCPHCANFHINVVPKIKKNYIDSGKVQLIFIDFPLDQAGFNAAKLLHCVDEKKQITYLDSIYENQNQWTAGSNLNEINDNLKNMANDLGITPTQFDKCLDNEVVADNIINNRINGHKKYSINSTPTIIINEKKFEGSADFKNIKKRIDKII